jgi:hypothetical protein
MRMPEQSQSPQNSKTTAAGAFPRTVVINFDRTVNCNMSETLRWPKKTPGIRRALFSHFRDFSCYLSNFRQISSW